ncbi:MAG: hypothetical protein JXA17_04990 [Dehalococcoidales bacterium]|nr:hypothetical protein [Dehalococcoidales bacterium]
MQEEILKLAKEIANQIEKEKGLPEKYQIETFKLILQNSLGIGMGISGKKSTLPIGLIGDEKSFSEFLNQIEEPKTNPQKFTAIAYYYEIYLKEISVSQENIITTMKEAGLLPPKNFTRDMNVATSSKNALLMKADPKDGKTAWRLTRTGRSFIEGKIKQVQ